MWNTNHNYDYESWTMNSFYWGFVSSNMKERGPSLRSVLSQRPWSWWRATPLSSSLFMVMMIEFLNGVCILQECMPMVDSAMVVGIAETLNRALYLRIIFPMRATRVHHWKQEQHAGLHGTLLPYRSHPRSQKDEWSLGQSDRSSGHSAQTGICQCGIRRWF